MKSPCKSGSRRSPKTHRCKPIKSKSKSLKKKSAKRSSAPQKSVKKSAKRRSAPQKSVKKSAKRSSAPQKSIKKSAKRSSAPQKSIKKSAKRSNTPQSPARHFTIGTRRKGRNGKMWKVADTAAGNLKWVQCGPAHKCIGPRAPGPLNSPKSKQKAFKLPKGFSPKRRNALVPAPSSDLWSDFTG
jgi:hypothetical protein